MSKVSFYRGSRDKYDETAYKDGIYFADDTLEILMNGNSYAKEDLEGLLTKEEADELYDLIVDRKALIDEEDDGDYVLKIVDAENNLLQGFKLNGEIEVPIGLTDDDYTLIYALYEKLKSAIEYINNIEGLTKEEADNLYASKEDTYTIPLVDSELEKKQDILTAGDGISIENNIVSNTLDTSSFETVDDAEKSHNELQENIDTEISDRTDLIEDSTDDTYVLKAVDAENNLLIGFKLNGELDVPNGLTDDSYDLIKLIIEKLQSLADTFNNSLDDLDGVTNIVTSLEDTKQDTLTAGSGIDITDNVISSTIDTGLYETIEAANTSHTELQTSIDTEIETREGFIDDSNDSDYVFKTVDANGALLFGFKNSGEVDIPNGVTDDAYDLVYALYEKLKANTEALNDVMDELLTPVTIEEIDALFD